MRPFFLFLHASIEPVQLIFFGRTGTAAQHANNDYGHRHTHEFARRTLAERLLKEAGRELGVTTPLAILLIEVAISFSLNSHAQLFGVDRRHDVKVVQSDDPRQICRTAHKRTEHVVVANDGHRNGQFNIKIPCGVRPEA